MNGSAKYCRDGASVMDLAGALCPDGPDDLVLDDARQETQEAQELTGPHFWASSGSSLFPAF